MQFIYLFFWGVSIMASIQMKETLGNILHENGFNSDISLLYFSHLKHNLHSVL